MKLLIVLFIWVTFWGGQREDSNHHSQSFYLGSKQFKQKGFESTIQTNNHTKLFAKSPSTNKFKPNHPVQTKNLPRFKAVQTKGFESKIQTNNHTKCKPNHPAQSPSTIIRKQSPQN